MQYSSTTTTTTTTTLTVPLSESIYMMDVFEANVRSGVQKYPRTYEKVIEYGTAGFRTLASRLDHVMFRMGLLAVLRSKYKQGLSVGVMVTASHNPAADNGVKLVDPHGDMLEADWEQTASQLANVSDAEVWSQLIDIIRCRAIDCSVSCTHVIIGRDTRESGEALCAAVQCGVLALGGNVRQLGIVTTPILHYLVHATNHQPLHHSGDKPPCQHDYYQQLSTAFCKLRTQATVSGGSYSNSLCVDGANGVGAMAVRQLMSHIAAIAEHDDHLQLTIYNERGQLNHMCGADYVKVQQCAPCGLAATPLTRCVSFDGDADRLVYFFVDHLGAFRLLDGDRIATLVAGYLNDLLKRSGLQLSLGLVQTAYANGSSTRYISEELQVPVVCVSTGVKHLHRAAAQFDIGVYFEANGHGTVLFSTAACENIRRLASDTQADQDRRGAAAVLYDVTQLVNQTVGDALSDMLLVETVLHSSGRDVNHWFEQYVDLPNRQLKVAVKDRRVVETTDAERVCVKPAGLQEAIDKLVETYHHGRAFVRPSGTEDVVRVYAEADTQTNADSLAKMISQELSHFCDAQV